MTGQETGLSATVGAEHNSADQTDTPDHGRGSLAHGYVEGECDDWCNNVACRKGLTHERCDESCSPPIRYDAIGGWQLTPDNAPGSGGPS